MQRQGEVRDARVVDGQGREHGRVVGQELRVRAGQRRPLRRLAEVVLRQRRRCAAFQSPGPLLALQAHDRQGSAFGPDFSRAQDLSIPATQEGARALDC